MSTLSHNTVDGLKLDPSNLRGIDSNQTTAIKGITSTGLKATLVIQPTHLQPIKQQQQLQQQQLQQQQQQQLAQTSQQQPQQPPQPEIKVEVLDETKQAELKVNLRAQNINNLLASDQSAASSPQTKQAFVSLKDACKRLLNYHVFDTPVASSVEIEKGKHGVIFCTTSLHKSGCVHSTYINPPTHTVDRIFDAAAETLIKRQRALYDKYRYLILKQSMVCSLRLKNCEVDNTFRNNLTIFSS